MSLVTYIVLVIPQGVVKNRVISADVLLRASALSTAQADGLDLAGCMGHGTYRGVDTFTTWARWEGSGGVY